MFGVERIPELVNFGRKNLEKYGFKNASINLADYRVGLEQEEPFDKILVSAAAEKLPEELLKQLRLGGRMIIPIKNSVWAIDKISEDELDIQKHPGFRFVPLV